MLPTHLQASTPNFSDSHPTLQRRSLVLLSLPYAVPIGANGVAIGDAIKDSRTRTIKVENAVSALQATLDSHDRTIKLLLARASASAGTAPPAPSAADADFLAGIDDARLRTIVQEMIGTKRARPESEDENAPKRLAPAIVIPAAFSLPTASPAPDFASPAFAPAATAVGLPAAVSIPTAYPTAPPPALPRAPPDGPPRVAIDPAREVLFGPNGTFPPATSS
ncbi:hypothetical protein B0H13DRAFT_2438664 [Mycena leptocephala]|nr:hypothetical protein B0H13DRAFT_2438664 [Mycena leptocephala]